MYWYHTDALGSVYQMTDEDETVVRTYDYCAFGKIISETGTLINPFTYTARELDDDSGLYYYRARYYDSTIGRFLSRDPVGLDKGEDIYVYVQNNPISLIDPTGKLSRKLARCYYACGYCVPSCVRDCRNRLKKVACPLLIQKIACPMLCEKQKNACIDCCDMTTAPDIFECAGHGFTEGDCSDW